MHSRISTLLVSLLIGLSLHAQEYQIDFKIKNAGVFVSGTFNNIEVNQNFDPDDLSTASFSVSIPVSTIDTGIKSRDRHLLKEKYFDAEHFPKIRFDSFEVIKTDKGYRTSGSLTIKNTTLPVNIDFFIDAEKDTIYFKGYLELDRRDYGVGKKHLILGNLVRISIKVPVDSSGM